MCCSTCQCNLGSLIVGFVISAAQVIHGIPSAYAYLARDSSALHAASAETQAHASCSAYIITGHLMLGRFGRTSWPANDWPANETHLATSICSTSGEAADCMHAPEHCAWCSPELNVVLKNYSKLDNHAAQQRKLLLTLSEYIHSLRVSLSEVPRDC